jgi:hypothetical protein
VLYRLHGDSYWTVRWWGNASGQWKEKCLNSLAWPAAVQLACQATGWCVYTGTVPGIQLLDTSTGPPTGTV